MWGDTDEVPLLKGGIGGNATNLQGTPLPPAKFIFHLHPAKSGLPIRGGLARAVAFIGVAILVLIVGYFSPLPPKAGEEI